MHKTDKQKKRRNMAVDSRRRLKQQQMSRFSVDGHKMNKMQLADHPCSLAVGSLKVPDGRTSQPISYNLYHHCPALYSEQPVYHCCCLLDHTRLVTLAVLPPSCGTSQHHKPTNRAPRTTL